jgi:hypothetical protein
MRINEAEAPEKAEEYFDAFISEIEHKLATNDFKIIKPTNPGKVSQNKLGMIDFSKRAHMKMENFCSDVELCIAAIHQNEATETIQAVYSSSAAYSGIFLYLAVKDNINPDTALTKDMVMRNINLTDDRGDHPIREALFHEYVHYLQNYSGFENIGRNLIMCWTPYLQLKWEIESHVAEFYSKFTSRIKQANTREDALQALKKASMDFAPYADETKDQAFAESVMRGDFSIVDKNMNAIVKANQKSSKRRFLIEQLKKAHRIILARLNEKPK